MHLQKIFVAKATFYHAIWNIVRDFELSSIHDISQQSLEQAHRSCLAYLIGTRALAKVGAGVSDDDSGRSLRSRCTRSRRFPSKCRQMRLVYPGARRRHCRNYPLRPPGPSERCLASAPYLEPAELSPPLSSLSHSVTLFLPSPPFRLPLSSSSTFVPAFLFALPRGAPWNPTNQPDQPAHPLCLTRRRRHRLPPSPFGTHNLSLRRPSLLGAGVRGCSLASDYSSRGTAALYYIPGGQMHCTEQFTRTISAENLLDGKWRCRRHHRRWNAEKSAFFRTCSKCTSRFSLQHRTDRLYGACWERTWFARRDLCRIIAYT